MKTSKNFYPILLILQIFLQLIPILTAIIVLLYLGPTFSDEDVHIDPSDWRRKWLIFFAWLSLIIILMNVIVSFNMLFNKKKIML